MQITVKILNGQEVRLEVGQICLEKKNNVSSFENDQGKTNDISRKGYFNLLLPCA